MKQDIPEKNKKQKTCIDGQLPFDKSAETIQNKKNSFSNKLCWEQLDSCMQKNDVGSLSYTICKK